MAQLAQYTKEQRDLIDRQIASMTDEQRDALDVQGGKILYRAQAPDKERQRGYMRTYRQRIALAKQMGIITLSADGE